MNKAITSIGKKAKGLALLVAVFIPLGCENFLDRPPQRDLTQEGFPITASDAQLATNAAYSMMRNWFYHSGGYPILDIMSDDAHKGSNPGDQEPNVGPYDRFQHTPTQDGLDRWWNSLYEGIRRCNVVIEKVALISMDETLKTRYIGEARFLRAVMYFDLVRAWGEVPKVVSTTPPLTLTKAPVTEIYELIEQDLLAAIEALQERNEQAPQDLGRATKGAARAILAKAYLFMGDYINAEKYALEVINSNQYSLEADFTRASGKAGEFGPESIFEIGAQENENTVNGGNQYGNVQGVRGTPNRGWGFNRPSIDLRDSYETGDPRMDGTIIFLGETIDGVLINGDGDTPNITYTDATNTVIKEIETYNQKAWIPGSNTITSWGHNRRVIRYADVLLIAAEAMTENNKAALALVHLNEVRARARGGNNAILPDITETDQLLLKDIILEERRHELALEGHRFWDLVRTGKAPAVLGPLGFVTGKHEVLPIPQSEVDITQGLISQHNAWK